MPGSSRVAACSIPLPTRSSTPCRPSGTWASAPSTSRPGRRGPQSFYIAQIRAQHRSQPDRQHTPCIPGIPPQPSIHCAAASPGQESQPASSSQTPAVYQCPPPTLFFPTPPKVAVPSPAPRANRSRGCTLPMPAQRNQEAFAACVSRTARNRPASLKVCRPCQ